MFASTIILHTHRVRPDGVRLDVVGASLVEDALIVDRPRAVHDDLEAESTFRLLQPCLTETSAAIVGDFELVSRDGERLGLLSAIAFEYEDLLIRLFFSRCLRS